MDAKLSSHLLSFFHCSVEEEPHLRKKLNNLLHIICKPCWELKYCPYGLLVEDFPLSPVTISDHTNYINYLKKCIECNAMGDNFDIPLDASRREIFIDTIKNDDITQYVDKVSKFEKESSCKEFGHLCPAFFVNESFTETSTGRNRKRNLSHSTIVRVVRRDNNTCQICGKVLLDRDIEIDHIIPYSRGGTSDESNLRVTCLECNRRKGKKYEL